MDLLTRGDPSLKRGNANPLCSLSSNADPVVSNRAIPGTRTIITM